MAEPAETNVNHAGELQDSDKLHYTVGPQGKRKFGSEIILTFRRQCVCFRDKPERANYSLARANYTLLLTCIEISCGEDIHHMEMQQLRGVCWGYYH